MSTFKAYAYNMASDRFEWQSFDPATLAARLACDAVLQLYGLSAQRIGSQTLVERTCLTGFVPVERDAIAGAWASWWEAHGESTEINGPDFVRPEMPNEPEIIEAIRARLAVAQAKAA